MQLYLNPVLIFNPIQSDQINQPGQRKLVPHDYLVL